MTLSKEVEELKKKVNLLEKEIKDLKIIIDVMINADTEVVQLISKSVAHTGK